MALPANLASIDPSAFSQCAELADITLAGENEHFYSTDGVLYYTATESGENVLEIAAFPAAKTGSYTVPAGITAIADYTFQYAQITAITLPEGLKTIGSYAFAESALTSIAIPASVTALEEAAFYQCQELKTVTFGEGSTLKTIGSNAFGAYENGDDPDSTEYCGITSIEIPASVTEIGTYAFYKCLDLRTVTFEEDSQLETIGSRAFGSYYTHDLYCGIESITIPNTVTSIGTNAFGNCRNLTSVTFEEGGTEELTFANGSGTSSSRYGVFGYCTALESITLPYRMKELARFAFIGCTALTQVNFEADESGNYGLESIAYGAFRETGLVNFVIPDSVEELATHSTAANNTFYGCESLVSITLPRNFTDDFSWRLVTGCDNLAEINVAAGNTEYTSNDGVLFTTDGTLVYYPVGKTDATGAVATSYTIPYGTREIGEYSFYHGSSDFAQVAHIVIPASVDTIGAYAFRSEALEEVTFEPATGANTDASDLEIGNYAFAYTSVRSLAFPARFSRAGTYLAAYNDFLTSVTFESGENSLTIGNYAFRDCTALAQIELPENLTSLGTYAFRESGLTSVTIPASLTEIPGYAFQDCVSLKTVEFAGSPTEIGGSAFRNTGLESIVIPESVTSLGTYAIAENEMLTDVVLPDGITELPSSLLRDCTALESVVIPDSVSEIGTYAFEGCTALEEVIFGERSSLLTLGNYAFQGCSALGAIDLPVSTASIGNNVFQNCTALESITLPYNVTSIGNYAFSGCTSLAEVDLSASLSSIGNYAFENCTALEAFTINGSLTSIGTNAFAGCTSLDLTIDESNASFVETETGGILYDSLYTSIVSVYGTLSGEIVIPDTIEELPAGMFAGTAVTRVVLPDSITEIADGMFEGCENLEEVVMLGRVTSIGANAFADSGLERITIGRYVTSIGEGAFRNCSNLTEVTFEPNGSSILQIADYAFQNCTSPTSIDLPVRLRNTMTDTGYSGIYYDVVEGIGAYAFDGCANLASVTFNVRGGQMLTEGLSFGDYAFRNTAITSMVLPTYLRGYLEATEPLPGSRRAYHPAIGSYCFDGCAALQSVTFNYHATESYYIGNYAFRNCTSLSELVNLPSSLSFTDPVATNACGTGIFQNCTALTEITLPSQSWSGSDVFAGCTGLTKVTFYMSANTGSTIGLNAFSGCTALSEVVLPENLTLIRTGAFAGCTALTSITLPASVTTVQAGAFEGWTASQTISVSFAAGQVPSGFASGWSGGATVAYANASALAALPGEGKQ